ncbi:MAG: hypothetical protein V7L05_08630 [Nostoc sp.]
MPHAQCPMPHAQFVTSLHRHSKLSSVIPLVLATEEGFFASL